MSILFAFVVLIGTPGTVEGLSRLDSRLSEHSNLTHGSNLTQRSHKMRHRLAHHKSSANATLTQKSDGPSPEARERAMHEMALFTHDVAVQWQQAFLESFYVVGIAELFDKTWFVALLLGLAYSVKTAFWASFAAQAIHTFVAAAFGMGVSQVIPVSTLHFMTSGIFGLLTIFYANEWFESDPFEDASLDGVKAKREESMKVDHGFLDAAFVSCFVVVFLAEWGDRTQVALIALTASLPLLPVIVGGLMAKFLLTATAVFVPSLLDKRRFTDRFSNGVTALAFATFTGLALIAGCKARAETLAST